MEAELPGHEAAAVEVTAQQLVARAIAPIKKEFLRPPPLRSSSAAPNDNKKNPAHSGSGLLKDNKSKRQLKRERREEQKSARNLCPELAKTGDVTSCPYNDKCRFSHDIEAFKAQKPADLDGQCPFLKSGGPCPYGLACRFSSTHEDAVPSSTGHLNGLMSSSEVNGLTKDVQKLLWKNKMRFSKADARLKSLGLLGPSKSKMKDLENKEAENGGSNKCGRSDDNGSCEIASDLGPKLEEAIKDDADAKSGSDELCPQKRRKTEVKCDPSETENEDVNVTEEVAEISSINVEPEAGCDAKTIETDLSLKLHPREKKLIDFREKLYLAPLTTVGNLPFRRVCKVLGVDVTCGEMAMCTNLLQGQASEWALLRHFIDINMGCPIDIVVNKGAGSALLTKPMRMKNIVDVASSTVEKPITIKVRTAYFEGKNRIDSLIADMGSWGASAVTIHGRSRQQRYSKLADWEYIYQCGRKAPKTLQVVGNGDVFSFLDWNNHRTACPELATCMVARGALIKPWIFTEIKEQRHWDISSGERLNILKDFVHFGLEHWGSDTKGVETTRRFLLEWLSYTCRYVPVGLLEVIPQRINWRPPSYYGRDELETLMASDSAADWIRISEMLLGKVPDGFTFAPKHKSNAYDRAENG
ncbi:hypothetical protein PIB30_008124 [Stylosanthes scabra]|uniref:tRNA-dihydrouridine(47) synthase [NAD(P)(+)] n=1 Tax=Stylosanthes scabra TaxID=79078 RepID=A0ABU6Y4T3_9FABA|nr:hypothetical protein [Stylosanthes scabra]